MKRCFVRDEGLSARTHEAEYYQWRYSENLSGKPIVYVAESEQKIVGLMAIVPKMMHIAGQTLLCAESGDTFWDPDCRGGNAFLRMAAAAYREAREAGIQFIYGCPNPVSKPVLERVFEYKTLFEYRSYVRPLALVSKLGTVGSSWVMFFYNALFPFKRKGQLKAESVSCGDGKLDHIWTRYDQSSHVGVVKNAEYMKWRYGANPEDYQFVMISADGAEVGYFVVKINVLGGFRFAHVVDWVFASDAASAFVHGLDCLLGYLREKQVELVNIWSAPTAIFQSRLKRLGFIRRKKAYWLAIRQEAADSRQYPDILDAALWSFSHGDTDNI